MLLRRFIGQCGFVPTLCCGVAIGVAPLSAVAAIIEPAAGPAPAPEPGSNVFNRYVDLSLEELMEVEVTSGSRQAQPLQLSTVPISVVPEELIHYSGLTSLPEILQFTPGVDVLRIDRNSYAVGVRGMHEVYGDRTLTLIDGRNATSPVNGDTSWLTLPVMLEDIERIEVVRGPGGAAWGANAFNGVINIIKKDPAETLGTFGSVRMTEYGDLAFQGRHAAATDEGAWRVSVAYTEQEPSEDSRVIPNPALGIPSEPEDWRRDLLIDTEITQGDRNGAHFEAGLAYVHSNHGPNESAAFVPDFDGRHDAVNAYVRIADTFADGSSGHLQWTGHYADTVLPSFAPWQVMESEAEAQYNRIFGQHSASFGASGRLTHIESSPRHPLDLAHEGGRFTDYWLGLFAIDRWQLAERIAIEGQLRGDYYSGNNEADWSGRLATLYSLDPSHHHVLRLAVARAYRTPLRGIAELGGERMPLGGGAFGAYLLPSEDLANESTASLEAGYQGDLTEHFSLRINGYYQRYDDLIGTRVHGLIPYVAQLDNLGEAEGLGFEAEANWRAEPVNLSIWYAWNGFETEFDRQDIRAYEPAEHKLGATARTALGDLWVGSANYVYSSSLGRLPLTEGAFPNDLPARHRLDVTLARAFWAGRGEMLVGVADVFDQSDTAVGNVLNTTGHETPGRTLFGRIQLTF